MQVGVAARARVISHEAQTEKMVAYFYIAMPCHATFSILIPTFSSQNYPQTTYPILVA